MRSGSYFSSYSGDNASHSSSKYYVNTGAHANKLMTNYEVMLNTPVHNDDDNKLNYSLEPP
jgi:hypothetical protein